jgi:guanylate kinase
VHGDLYGTPRANLEKLRHGENLVLEIDTQGARKIREVFSDGVLVFILPPSLEVLKGRLQARGGDSEEAIAARLHNAQEELDQMAWYDYIVVNKEIEEATRQLASIITAEQCKTARVLTKG